MAIVGTTDCRQSVGTEPNTRKFGIFISISMFCFLAGFIFLKYESNRSVHVDIKNDAYQTYQEHKQKLNAIGWKYSKELDGVKKKDNLRGNN